MQEVADYLELGQTLQVSNASTLTNGPVLHGEVDYCPNLKQRHGFGNSINLHAAQATETAHSPWASRRPA
jgi:hypothetical protein